MTDGCKMLRAYFDEKRGMNQTQLAQRLRIEQPSVSAWAAGTTRPKPAYRQALEALINIPEKSWMTKSERALVADAQTPRAAESSDDLTADRPSKTGT